MNYRNPYQNQSNIRSQEEERQYALALSKQFGAERPKKDSYEHEKTQDQEDIQKARQALTQLFSKMEKKKQEQAVTQNNFYNPPQQSSSRQQNSFENDHNQQQYQQQEQNEPRNVTQQNFRQQNNPTQQQQRQQQSRSPHYSSKMPPIAKTQITLYDENSPQKELNPKGKLPPKSNNNTQNFGKGDRSQSKKKVESQYSQSRLKQQNSMPQQQQGVEGRKKSTSVQRSKMSVIPDNRAYLQKIKNKQGSGYGVNMKKADSAKGSQQTIEDDRPLQGAKGGVNIYAQNQGEEERPIQPMKGNDIYSGELQDDDIDQFGRLIKQPTQKRNSYSQQQSKRNIYSRESLKTQDTEKQYPNKTGNNFKKNNINSSINSSQNSVMKSQSRYGDAYNNYKNQDDNNNYSPHSYSKQNNNNKYNSNKMKTNSSINNPNLKSIEQYEDEIQDFNSKPNAVYTKQPKAMQSKTNFYQQEQQEQKSYNPDEYRDIRDNGNADEDDDDNYTDYCYNKKKPTSSSYSRPKQSSYSLQQNKQQQQQQQKKQSYYGDQDSNSYGGYQKKQNQQSQQYQNQDMDQDEYEDDEGQQYGGYQQKTQQNYNKQAPKQKQQQQYKQKPQQYSKYDDYDQEQEDQEQDNFGGGYGGYSQKTQQNFNKQQQQQQQVPKQKQQPQQKQFQQQQKQQQQMRQSNNYSNEFNSNQSNLNENNDDVVAKATGFGQADIEEYQQEKLYDCPKCGRSFRKIVLQKHTKICDKVNKKRKVFDSSKMRQTDEQQQVSYTQPPAPKYGQKKQQQAKQQSKQQQSKSSKNAKWKKDSEAFRAMLRQEKGEKLTHQEQQAIQNLGQADDLVPCPTCGRKFNEQAANRHIPSCAERQKAASIKNANKKAFNSMKEKTKHYGRKF